MERMIIETGKTENCVLIPVNEYRELLEIKGRYLELKDSNIVGIPIGKKGGCKKWL